MLNQIRKIFLLSRPVLLLFALLAYGLGLGIARYLGVSLHSEPQIFGGLIVVLLVAASNILVMYFRPHNEPIIPDETRKEGELLRSQLLLISFSLIVTITVLGYLLNQGGFISPGAGIILLIFVLMALGNAVPPVRLQNRGMGELSSAIQIASLTPGLAFLLQNGSAHRLLFIFTFPLLLLAIAYFLASSFPDYKDDLKYERKNLLMSLSWQRAVTVHSVLLITAYLFFAAIPFWGVSFSLAWPALLTLPIAIYQIHSLGKIANGSKPVWTLFVATATADFGLTLYLIALTLWLR